VSYFWQSKSTQKDVVIYIFGTTFWQKCWFFLWQNYSDKNVNFIFGKTKPHKNVFWQTLFDRNVGFILAKQFRQKC